MRRLSLIGLLAWFVFPSATGGDEPAEVDEELKSIQQFVIDCQKAGYERNEFEAYDVVWGEKAKVVIARGPEPGKYETTLNREQIRESRRLRMLASPVSNLKLDFRDISIVRDGKQVVLKWTVHATHDDGQQETGEIYRLAETDKGWRVVEHRSWPIRLKYGDWSIEYTSRMWNTLDAAIDRSQDNLEADSIPFELAGRFSEGYQFWLNRTQNASATAGDWAERGQFAFRLGMIEDALSSFRTAREIDSEVELPEFVIKALEDRK